MMLTLGQTVATPGAIELLERLQVNPITLLARHSTGDWGDVDASDKAANDAAAKGDGRVLSAYSLQWGNKVWVITEADRSVTTILLPQEY